MLRKEVHSKNDDSSICFTEGGIFIAINEEQCANALKPILDNEDWLKSTISFKDVHKLMQKLSILLAWFGIVISVKRLHLLKANFPM